MSYWFIVNPVATKCPANIEARIRERFPRSEVWLTECAGDTAGLASKAVQEGAGPFDHVIACGGDGTFREVAGEVGGRTRVGMLPLGTVNLVARQLGIPRGLSAALDSLREGDTALVYPGRCVLDGVGPGEMFFIGVSAGLDADAVHEVSSSLKKRVGKFAYLLSLLGRLRRPVEPEVTVRSAAGSGKFGQVVVLKMPDYGGPYRLGHRVELSAPWIEGVAVERGRMDVLRLFLASARGQARDRNGTARWVNTHTFLELPEPGRLQIDGDPFLARHVELYPHPAPIRVLCGPDVPGS